MLAEIDALAAHFAGLDDAESPLASAAWVGLPLIAWEADAAFAAAADLSTTAARGLIRDALTLAHRLPLTWARVRAGEMNAWRARQIAAAVAGAPRDVCDRVDLEVAPRADAIGRRGLENLITAVMIDLYSDEIEAASLARLDQQHVTFHRDQITHTGLSRLDARAEYADLHDFDALLTRLARELPRIDDTIHASDPLDYRRARALGVLSDPALVARLLADPLPADAAPSRPRTTLVVQVSDRSLLGGDVVAGVGHHRVPVFADVVAAWCGRASSDLTVLPVLDLNEHRGATGYTPSTLLRRHVELRDQTCRYPHCTQPAARADLDHVIPYARGGPTTSSNLIALCRHHHRLKTHAG